MNSRRGVRNLRRGGIGSIGLAASSAVLFVALSSPIFQVDCMNMDEGADEPAGLSEPSTTEDNPTPFRGATVTICHQDDDGRFRNIVLAENALPAHLRHGDCVIDDGIACTTDVCDPALGCLHITDNAVCDNGDACDGAEVCDATDGCRPGEPLECDDGDVCNGVESCDPEIGCLSGTPLDCDDGIACTEDLCDPEAACMHVPVDAECDDGNVCNGIETCDATQGCQAGVPLNCDDGIPCTIDSCDPELGCQNSPSDNACNDGNVCTDDRCDPEIGCRHLSNTRPCDDGDPCTGSDVCSNRSCAGVDICEVDISFTAPAPFCSFDNVNCTGAVAFDVRVDGADPPASLAFVLDVDLSADGTIDQQLDVNTALTGTAPDFTISGTFPLGQHRLEVMASDATGSMDTASIPFEVVDCKAPTPICINGLAIELMPVNPPEDVDGDGDQDVAAMTVFASDFIASPVTDCSPPVSYSINRTGDTPDSTQAGLVLTCDDSATVLVEIHAWDSAADANHDFCETYILVQDNMVSCP